MSENNTILSRIFTQNILKGLVDNESDATSGLLTVVRRYHISHENGKTNEEVISEIYSHLDKTLQNKTENDSMRSKSEILPSSNALCRQIRGSPADSFPKVQSLFL